MRFSLRTFVVACIVLGALFAVMYKVIGVFSFLADPVSEFVSTTEYVDLSGRDAKSKIREWPDAIDPKDVLSVSYKSKFARDSYYSWYRIKLSGEVANEWQDLVHHFKEKGPQEYVGDSHEGFEGVHRIIPGPPRQQNHAGVTPQWWNPPDADFRATEVMVWYEDFYPGVGHAVYSAFDDKNGELWVYDYYSQHDELWANGKAPSGKSFRKYRNKNKVPDNS